MPREPEPSHPQASERPSQRPSERASQRPGERPSQPVPPEQSFEDTDAAWGEYREPEDDERLSRDRPPHWDDF